MFSVAVRFITGCMVGIEFFSGADVNDSNLSLGVVIDVLIVRFELGFHKLPPAGFV